jgi:hypothetical protein
MPPIGPLMNAKFRQAVYGPDRKKQNVKIRMSNSRDTSRNVRNISIAAKRTAPMRRGYFRTHMSGWPQKQSNTLRLTETSIAGTALAGSGFSEFGNVIMNGAFSPFGGAPLAGFNRLMQVYTKCYVLNAKVSMKITQVLNVGFVTPSAILAGITLTTNTTAFTNPPSATDPGMCDYKQVATSPDTVTVFESVNVSKFMTVDDIMMGSQFLCTNAANPAQIVVAHLWVQNMTANVTNFCFHVVVDMECMFADPVPVT